MSPRVSGQTSFLMHTVLFVSKCYCPFCLFCTFLKPVVGLEIQRSVRDKFKLEYSFFIVQDIFCTSLFIMYWFSFISRSGELYLMALFFAQLPGISFSFSVSGQSQSMIAYCYFLFFFFVITLSVCQLDKVNYSVFVENSVDVLCAIYFRITLGLLFLASVCFKL